MNRHFSGFPATICREDLNKMWSCMSIADNSRSYKVLTVSAYDSEHSPHPPGRLIALMWCSLRAYSVALARVCWRPSKAPQVLGCGAAGPKPLGVREKQLLGKRQKAVLDFLRENRGPHTAVGRTADADCLLSTAWLSHGRHNSFTAASGTVSALLARRV